MIANALGQPQATAIRKPQFQIAFGSLAFGGLSTGISQLSSNEDPWQRSILSIHTQCGQAPQTDISKLVIANDQLAPEVALDDEGSVKLGYDDASVDAVMSGYIHRLSTDTRNTKTIAVTNGGTLLSQLRINQSYEQQTAGDVVSDLCGQVEVATDTVETGVDLPFYVIDDRQNAYQQIHRLAQLSGYVAYFTQAGELYFGPEQAGSAVQTFSYSKDILELRIQRNNSAASAVTVIGEGSAGAEGQDAWSWLIKDPSAVTVEAGEGKARLIRNGALRNLEGAQAMAEGLAGAAQAKSLSGQILTPGAPAVIVGSRIEISDAPAEDMNGEFYVTGVSHRYDKRAGFTSLIHFKQASAGGFSLGGLL